MKGLKALYLISILFLFGCASGSSIVVGEVRPPIDPSEVRLYLEVPKNYEPIAIVNASSDAGFTEQGSVNYAVQELKNQAAKIGANGIILDSTGTRNSVMLGGQGTDYQYLIPVTAQTVSGTAVYIEPES
ncbi:hypothetical protein RJ45_26145 [Photobacterium gaetbulicola]|uniref:Lipoprotein n=1 Tax=Photobacterium gaetbulicola TaxID=1295392 RepID=A0A0B9FNC2_9GAMM|nr:hypothetical protein [Photobacterium gaetbulicola]KHT57938.1 hypothetical protein RJ45_26145 [Photobacterium gaetbulicola]